jgi:hypothetical protein
VNDARVPFTLRERNGTQRDGIAALRQMIAMKNAV